MDWEAVRARGEERGERGDWGGRANLTTMWVSWEPSAGMEK